MSYNSQRNLKQKTKKSYKNFKSEQSKENRQKKANLASKMDKLLKEKRFKEEQARIKQGQKMYNRLKSKNGQTYSTKGKLFVENSPNKFKRYKISIEKTNFTDPELLQQMLDTINKYLLHHFTTDITIDIAVSRAECISVISGKYLSVLQKFSKTADEVKSLSKHANKYYHHDQVTKAISEEAHSITKLMNMLDKYSYLINEYLPNNFEEKYAINIVYYADLI